MEDQNKDLGGRQPFYKTADELQTKVDEYFSTDKGQKKPTISGLAYHLGFESRQSFYDYEKKPGFTYTIKRARLRIEETYEGNLHDSAAGGSIFALKNMDWTDRQDHDFKGTFTLEQITGMRFKTTEETTDGEHGTNS